MLVADMVLVQCIAAGHCKLRPYTAAGGAAAQWGCCGRGRILRRSTNALSPTLALLFLPPPSTLPGAKELPIDLKTNSSSKTLQGRNITVTYTRSGGVDTHHVYCEPLV